MLEYGLGFNELTKEAGDMRAKTVNVISRGQSEIIERMLQSGAGLTRSDALSVLEAEKEAIYAILADGAAVTTGLFNAFPSAQGVFTGADTTVLTRNGAASRYACARQTGCGISRSG
jgi:hypothetical protein